MDVVLQALRDAIALIAGGDAYTFEVLGLSLRVSLTATGLALALGLPIGMVIALVRFPGRRVVWATATTGMGLPPVVVGLVVTVTLWRAGPLGGLGLLYTPAAMVIAQTIIALPLVIALSAAAIQQVDPDLATQLRGIGASRLRALWEVVGEARLPLLATALAGFGAALSEVGAAMMVGGNLLGETRVLTTAAVLEASRGNFATALAFGLVLLVVAFSVNLVLVLVTHRGRIAVS